MKYQVDQTVTSHNYNKTFSPSLIKILVAKITPAHLKSRTDQLLQGQIF